MPSCRPDFTKNDQRKQLATFAQVGGSRIFCFGDTFFATKSTEGITEKRGDRRCAAGSVDHLAFRLQLCELDLIDRERRAAGGRLEAAQFPNRRMLVSFELKSHPSLNRLLVTELLRGEYIDRRKTFLPSGTCKTHVIASLGAAKGNGVIGSSYAPNVAASVESRAE